MLYSEKLMEMIDRECTKNGITSACFKELYAMIFGLSFLKSESNTRMKSYGYCFASDDYFSKRLNVSAEDIQLDIAKMVELSWINIEIRYILVEKHFSGKIIKEPTKIKRKIFPLFGITK